MKIGIDIDDTTFLTVKSMLKYADIFEEAINENNICVVGNPKNIDEASSMFDNIRNLD